jgi:small subunit ribosomal protein S6
LPKEKTGDIIPIIARDNIMVAKVFRPSKKWQRRPSDLPKPLVNIKRGGTFMRVYEAMYILDPSLEEDKVTQSQEKFSEMVSKAGGEIVSLENWGKRKLAYEIKGQHEGFYIVMRFNSEEKSADTLRKNFRIADEVLKSLLIRMN